MISYITFSNAKCVYKYYNIIIRMYTANGLILNYYYYYNDKTAGPRLTCTNNARRRNPAAAGERQQRPPFRRATSRVLVRAWIILLYRLEGMSKWDPVCYYNNINIMYCV